MPSGDTAFVGAIPTLYEQLLVPLIFAEPATHLAAAVLAAEPREVLETAAGTGVLTRALVAAGTARITATDLNQPMLETATQRCPSPRVQWQLADALALPFADDSFDALACQFGVMFFPDKVRGHAEARRVLRPGGVLHFNVWDRIEANPAWQVVDDALNAAVPHAPLEFLRRAPYSYFDPDRIRADLAAAGYADVLVQTMSGTSESTAADTARAICQATPLRMALAAHPVLTVLEATAIATAALRAEYGAATFRAPISWLQIQARSQPH